MSQLTGHGGGSFDYTIAEAANLSILEIVEGAVSFVDTRNNKRDGKVYLKPVGTVVAGVASGRPYQSPFSVR
jgi:dihydroorotase